MLRQTRKNVYTYGPIIHNTEVVNELESKGVKAVNDISEIPEPEKSTVIIDLMEYQRQYMNQ